MLELIYYFVNETTELLLTRNCPRRRACKNYLFISSLYTEITYRRYMR